MLENNGTLRGLFDIGLQSHQAVFAGFLDAERNLRLEEHRQRLLQVRSHQNLAGQAGDLVGVTGKFPAFLVAIAPGVLVHLLEGFGGANDRTVWVVYRHGAQADANFVSCFVVQKADLLCRLRGLEGTGNRAILVAEFTAGLVPVQQSF